MSDAEWKRAEDLARSARTSRTKVLRVALAVLDLDPDQIGELAYHLSDGKFNGGSPAASAAAAASEKIAERVAGKGQVAV